MSRTSSSKVQEILVDHYDSVNSISLTAFISTANSLTNKVASNDADTLLSSTDLELVERWLAAHFYAHADQLSQSRGGGRANASFQGQTAMALTSTQYGQTAMVLDVTGYLSRLSQQAVSGPVKASMSWLGTRMKYDKSQTAGDQ
jgi:hypothetical protein